MSAELVRLTDSILWELRRHWASGKRVALSLTEQSGRRIEGQVTRVSPTGAWVKVNGVQIQTEDILAVHYPSILGDSTYRGGRWHFDGLRIVAGTGQLEIPGLPRAFA